ncbi:MAG: hypothetical protein V1783_10715, partial [Bacteroidota bacterium]
YWYNLLIPYGKHDIIYSAFLLKSMPYGQIIIFIFSPLGYAVSDAELALILIKIKDKHKLVFIKI